MSIEQQTKLLDTFWLERLILRWDLPISLEQDKAKAIAQLGQADRDFLLQHIMAQQPKDRPLREKQLVRRHLSPDIKRTMEARQRRGKMI